MCNPYNSYFLPFAIETSPKVIIDSGLLVIGGMGIASHLEHMNSLLLFQIAIGLWFYRNACFDLDNIKCTYLFIFFVYNNFAYMNAWIQ